MRSKLHSLSGMAWRGVALCCMVLALGFIAGGVPEALVAWVFISPWESMGCLPRAFSDSSSGQRLLCILGVYLCMASWLWLCSAFGVVAFVCFRVFPLQGLYRSWKTWKVMEFKYFSFQAWKVMEFNCWLWKGMENYSVCGTEIIAGVD